MNPLGMARAAVFRSRMMDAEGWRSHGDVSCYDNSYYAFVARAPHVRFHVKRVGRYVLVNF